MQAAEEAVHVCGRLPLVDVRWQQPRPAPAKADADDEGEAEEAMLLSVELRRLPKVGGGRGGSQTRVYAPRFPKVGCSPAVLHSAASNRLELIVSGLTIALPCVN